MSGSPAWRAAAPRMLPALLALSLLAGCGLNRVAPQARLFDLGPGPAVSPSQPGGAGDHRQPLAVNFSATQMLADTGVIWRVGDSASPHSYATYRWAAPPMQLVRQRVVDLLAARRPVVPDGVDPSAPLLQVTLTRFEQVYAPDGKSSQGQVEMQAVLLSDHHVKDSVRLARSASAPTQDAQGGVAALRVATDAAARDLAAWVGQRLATSGAAPAAGLTLRSHSRSNP